MKAFGGLACVSCVVGGAYCNFARRMKNLVCLQMRARLLCQLRAISIYAVLSAIELSACFVFSFSCTNPYICPLKPRIAATGPPSRSAAGRVAAIISILDFRTETIAGAASRNPKTTPTTSMARLITARCPAGAMPIKTAAVDTP